MKLRLKQKIAISIILLELFLILGCVTQKSIIAFDDGYMMNSHWVVMQNSSKVHDLSLLLLRNYATYEMETKDMQDGQKSSLELGGAVYPEVLSKDQGNFPLELFVFTKDTVKLHKSYQGDLERTHGENQLHWTANENRVPPYFGYFGYTTQGIVTSVWMTRDCTPLGNNQARIAITIRATKPYLIRVWNVGQIKVEPDTITPKGLKLSDNGVLFFNYSNLGKTSEISFMVSGIKKGELYYPMTNAMLFESIRSKNFPEKSLTEFRGKAWEYEFNLRSKYGFKITNLERWTNEEYKLKELIFKDNK